MSQDRTKILCRINTHPLCETLGLSVDVSEGQQFIEGSFPLVYKQMSPKSRIDKLAKLMKLNQTLEGITMPYPTYIFQSKV